MTLNVECVEQLSRSIEHLGCLAVGKEIGDDEVAESGQSMLRILE
jgi:hypothetical protein